MTVEELKTFLDPFPNGTEVKLEYWDEYGRHIASTLRNNAYCPDNNTLVLVAEEVPSSN